MKQTPFPEIIRTLRERRGLEPDDSSEDSEIAKYSPRKALEECCGWHIGDTGWADQFMRWAEGAGFTIVERSCEASQAKQEIEWAERVAADTKKQFSYNKHTGEWSWFNSCDADDMENWHSGFPTRLAALMDALEPYLSDDE